MHTRKIGSLDVSAVGLGCNNFGGRLDLEGTRMVVDSAIEAGINFFDTADIYGKTKSEEYLGELLTGRRNRVILATKFGMEVDPEHTGAKPAYVRQAAEDSLRRLKTEHIDLYQLHQPDESTPIGETLSALNELVQEGKVREIGCSNFSAKQLWEAREAVKQGAARFISVQNEFSLLHREPEKEVLGECQREGIAFLPYFPLASGLLTGKYRLGRPLPQGTRIQANSRWLTDYSLETVELLVVFAESHGRTLLELAFAWLLAHPEVSSVIAGATKPEQIHANVHAADWELTADEFAEVSTIAERGELIHSRS